MRVITIIAAATCLPVAGVADAGTPHSVVSPAAALGTPLRGAGLPGGNVLGTVIRPSVQGTVISPSGQWHGTAVAPGPVQGTVVHPPVLGTIIAPPGQWHGTGIVPGSGHDAERNSGG